MRTLCRPIASFAVVWLALLLAACDQPPTAPPVVPLPASIPSASIVRLEIAGPPSVEPGGSTQLKATAVKSDGSLEDVTARVAWISSDIKVLQISAAGVMTGVARGYATVHAVYVGRGATTVITVLPRGTFVLAGQATDTGLPVENVRVEILNGIGEGQTAVTSANGEYVIYGVAGDVRVQAKREGYRNQIHEVNVSGPHMLHLVMAFEGTRQNVAGPYRLTITASCPAGSTFPESARIRAYDALVEQDGPRLTVRLSGAPLIVINGRGDQFTGRLEGSTATFNLAVGDFYYQEPGIVERFGETQTLTILGYASTTSGPEGLVGTMDGTVALSNRIQPPFTPLVSCSSPAHRFDMRRR